MRSCIDVSPDGKAIYIVHEVMSYDDFGETGAVSFWHKGRDIAGKPIFQKVQVRKLFQKIHATSWSRVFKRELAQLALLGFTFVLLLL